jgi:hypothetical protein
MAEFYKVKADTVFHHPIRELEELADGTKLYESVGVAYREGDYVSVANLSERDKERAENGELDHLLEEATADEVKEAEAAERAAQYGVFIAEHEAERVALVEYGHEVVPEEQLLELKSAGADEAKEVMEKVHAEGLDERPNLGLGNIEEEVDVAKLEGVEQPPGVLVGPDKLAAEDAVEQVPSGDNSSEEPKATRRRKAQPKGETADQGPDATPDNNTEDKK